MSLHVSSIIDIELEKTIMTIFLVDRHLPPGDSARKGVPIFRELLASGRVSLYSRTTRSLSLFEVYTYRQDSEVRF